MSITRWKRLTDSVLTITDLAQLVYRGFQIAKEENEDTEYKGLTVQIPMELHDRLDELVKRIPGMTKAKLVEFFLGAGIYEFSKALVMNSPENNLFPDDTKAASTLEYDQVITEALAILDRR